MFRCKTSSFSKYIIRFSNRSQFGFKPLQELRFACPLDIAAVEVFRCHCIEEMHRIDGRTILESLQATLGPLLLNAPVRIHPLILLLVIPCCTAPLAGAGAALGMTGRTQQQSGHLTFLLMLVMTALSPASGDGRPDDNTLAR